MKYGKQCKAVVHLSNDIRVAQCETAILSEQTDIRSQCVTVCIRQATVTS